MAQFFWYALTSSNINWFSQLFYCQNQEKIVIILSLKIPPHLKCVATLPCEIYIYYCYLCLFTHSALAGLLVRRSVVTEDTRHTHVVVWHLGGLRCSRECYGMRESERGERPRGRQRHWSVTGLQQPLVRSSLMSRKRDSHQTTIKLRSMLAIAVFLFKIRL